MSHAATLAAFAGAGPMAQAEAMSPHRQIELLLGGLLTRIARLRHAMRQPKPEARRDDSDRALAILAYLRAVLDPQGDPQLVAQLDSLYRYCEARILAACLAREESMLQEVTSLITDIKQGWDGIAPQHAAAA
jgi:flagellar secretion chaperone FliS